MRNKWKTFWQLIFLAIISFPALHFLGISIHSVESTITLGSFDVAGIIATVSFFIIDIFVAIGD
jgi:hypothetical protein